MAKLDKSLIGAVAEVGKADYEPISDGHESERIWHKGKYIEYYRKVFADALGIDPDKIPSDMLVHHIDGDRMNNDLDNLMLCTKKAHERLETMIHPEMYCEKDN